MSEYICPHCKKPIYDDEAILCLYCGESLNRPGKFFPKKRIIFLLILGLVIAGFLLFLILR